MGLFNLFNKPSTSKPYYRPVVLNDLKKELNVTLPPASIPERHEGYGKIGISDRVGIKGIYLNHTRANHIQQQYGMAYDFWDINGKSMEMKYDLLGFSCFFHQDDPQRKIFSIRMWKKFPVFQQFSEHVASGIKDYLVLHDVFTHEEDEVEPTKSYDETYFVDFGFRRYHFYLDEHTGPTMSTPIESIVLILR